MTVSSLNQIEMWIHFASRWNCITLFFYINFGLIVFFINFIQIFVFVIFILLFSCIKLLLSIWSWFFSFLISSWFFSLLILSWSFSYVNFTLIFCFWFHSDFSPFICSWLWSGCVSILGWKRTQVVHRDAKRNQYRPRSSQDERNHHCAHRSQTSGRCSVDLLAAQSNN